MHTGAVIPSNPVEELERNRQQAEQAQLTKKERRQHKRDQKLLQRQRVARNKKIKTILSAVAGIVIVGGALFGLVKLGGNLPSLPPTVMEGHIEVSPPGHILDEPMPENIQKHMLEHADGGGSPGIIIQYNCEDYDCEPDLIEKLTELARTYPEFVYLAPNTYEGKIILTKLRDREIFDTFDEAALKSFIEE